ncbi:MAG TPA: hypothetical protein VFD38_12230, partial [Myxococcaceae bacterium]|nr:hypothetical protein [Myxococcaceae bacterium]
MAAPQVMEGERSDPGSHVDVLEAMFRARPGVVILDFGSHLAVPGPAVVDEAGDADPGGRHGSAKPVLQVIVLRHLCPLPRVPWTDECRTAGTQCFGEKWRELRVDGEHDLDVALDAVPLVAPADGERPLHQIDVRPPHPGDFT